MVIFEQDFEEMLRNHQASLDDRKKFTALVKDLFPDQAKNVNLLLMAYNMESPRIFRQHLTSITPLLSDM